MSDNNIGSDEQQQQPPPQEQEEEVIVNFVWSWANILSGNLEDCQDADDETCQGGLSAVNAWVRHYERLQQQEQQDDATPTHRRTLGGSLVIPRVDYQSAFCQMHPLEWAVNRYVFSNYFHWSVFFAYPSFLFSPADNAAVKKMQTHDLQPLLSNTNIAPSNSWSPYVKRVHLDVTTRLAVMSIDHPRQPLATPQLESAMGILDYIHQLNVVNGCINQEAKEEENEDSSSSHSFDEYVKTHSHLFDTTTTTTTNTTSNNATTTSFWGISTNATYQNGGDTTNTQTNNTSSSSCWIPIIVYEESSLEPFTNFVNVISKYQYPPSLIIDVRGNEIERYAQPQLIAGTTTWVVSYYLYYLQHYQQEITIRHGKITNVTLLNQDLSLSIPEQVKDTTFRNDIAFFRILANEAAANNPIIGQTMQMPSSEQESLNLRQCMGGECPLGNLFADAIAWRATKLLMMSISNTNGNDDDTAATTMSNVNDTNATTTGGNVMNGGTNNATTAATVMPISTSSSTTISPPPMISFLNSGGIRGPGWPAGNVRISDLWQALPFSNTLCMGKMTGLSLYNLFDYSMSMATFQSTYTINGDRLLQVSSSIRITYNTLLNQTISSSLSSAPSRLVLIEVWNETIQEFEPLERLKVYPFATDSWMCEGFDPFPSLLGSEMLVIPGEESGVVHGGLLSYQNIVAEYLMFLNETNPSQWYNTSIQGRLVNDTDGTAMVSMIQTEESCRSGTYWKSNYLTCFDCPDMPTVRFTTENAAFSGTSGDGRSSNSRVDDDDDEAGLQYNTTEIVNDESFPVSVALKSKPDWVNFVEPLNLQPLRPDDEKNNDGYDDDDEDSSTRFSIPPGGRLALRFTASAVNLEAGTAQESIAFAVLDGGNFPGCMGQDIVLPVLMRVDKQPEVTKLGQVRIVGLSLTALAIILTAIFCSWVHCYRERQVVKSMQPVFLMTLCVGLFTIATSIIPLSITDDIASSRGRDMSCMAFPWLFSIGFIITASALYSKLWRINKLFNNGSPFRRQTVLTKDVLLPGVVLFTLNFLTITVWTIWDPLQYEIRQVEEEDWVWYGSCTGMGTPGKTLLGLDVAVNITALFMACYQAYKARNISHDYSEVKQLAIALFGWVQILVVGIPVLFLIENDNRNARYLLTVLIIFLVSMSMLLIIFVPMMLQLRQSAAARHQTSSVHISGLDISAFQNSGQDSSMYINTRATPRNGSTAFGGSRTRDNNNINNLSPSRSSLSPNASGTTSSSNFKPESALDSKSSMDGSGDILDSCSGVNNTSNKSKELESVLEKDGCSEVSEENVPTSMRPPVVSSQKQDDEESGHCH